MLFLHVRVLTVYLTLDDRIFDPRWLPLACVLLMFVNTSQKLSRDAPLPAQFEIGRHTFFDFGPPHDYYEIFLVRPAENGTSIERITLVPHGVGCIRPKLEIARASLNDSVAALLSTTNPCAIPEKELTRERKRCKHCMNFSGADIAMQVHCGSRMRLLRANVLERDWFEADGKTPERTSWAMRLLGRLDQAVGPGVMERPAFDSSNDGRNPPGEASGATALEDLAAGGYDGLFGSAPDKPSELYRAVRNAPPPPSVELVSSKPFSPEVFVKPAYPLLGGLLAAEGLVSFTVQIDDNGTPVRMLELPPPAHAQADLHFETGVPSLWHAVRIAVADWRFPKEATGQEVRVELNFTSNCKKDSH